MRVGGKLNIEYTQMGGGSEISENMRVGGDLYIEYTQVGEGSRISEN